MPEWSNGPHSKCGIRVTVSRVRIPVSPHKQAQRLDQSSLLRFFFQRTCRFPRTRQPGSPSPQPQASQSHPHVISTAATHTCHAIGSRKRMHRTAKRGHRTAQQKAQARTREHERPVQQDAQPSAAEGTGPHDTKTLTGLFRRDEEAAGSRRLGWRGSLPAVLPCRGMENAARCVGQRSVLHRSPQHAASGIAPHCVFGGTVAGNREKQPGRVQPEPSAALLFAFRASAHHIRHAATDAFRQKALTLCSYGKADKEIQ